MLLSTLSTLHLNQSVMPKPVYLLTVQEAHKEYSSLTDQIRAKYEQLDSGEFGSPGTPHSSSIEDNFWIKITLGRQFV